MLGKVAELTVAEQQFAWVAVDWWFVASALEL